MTRNGRCHHPGSAASVARLLIAMLALAVGATGCGGARGMSNVEGERLRSPVAVREGPWEYQGVPGRTLDTEHYRIFTTVSPDDPLFATLPQLLEAGYREYRIMAGDAVGTPTATEAVTAGPTHLRTASGRARPLECFIFARREHWNDFTSRYTGQRARLLLQIVHGAYAIDDVFVAYDIGDARTISATAHEGWHQFAGRNFKTKLPPFIEEGIASQFEEVSEAGRVPTFAVGQNTRRLDGLRYATRERFTFPLSQLIGLHPGQVMAYPADRLDAYYSQVWAFVRFLRDYDSGRYRPAFERLLTDAAHGQVKGLATDGQWGRDNIPKIIVGYFGTDVAQMEREYLLFCRKLIGRD
jgi:hypothetical protein